jgi:hypothetical protein
MAAIGLVKIVLGALGGLSMAVLIVWVGFRADPLGLFQSSGKGQAKKPSNTVAQTPQQPSVQPRVVHTPQSSPTPSDPRNTTQEQSAPHTSESPAEKVVTPSQPPPPMVVTPMPATPEPPQPASPVVAAQRRPPPTADEQAAKLAELKEVYDKEFEGANRPGTREVFPDFLIDTSEKLKSDPVARFVLLREAFTRLIAQKEFTLAAEVVDRLDREFDMDPFSLRTHTLTKASESAKLPAEKLAIVLCSADLAEAALAQQRIAEATTLVRMADGHARTLPDNQLKARTVTLRAEVEAAAQEWGPVERARQTLATAPDDPAAAAVDGRYRCLTLGDWQQGLPLVAKGNDQTLAAAAVKDLGGASGEVTATTIGDMWYDLAQSDPKLAACHARAAHWYRQAVASATGLDKVRLEKRLETIAELKLPERLSSTPEQTAGSLALPPFAPMLAQNVKFEPVNLFKFVQQAELLKSPWNYDRSSTAQDPAIYSDPSKPFGRVPSHFNSAPREYQMSLNVTRDYRSSGSGRDGVTGPLVIGLVGPRSQFAVVLDYPIGGQFVSMIALKDAKSESDNPTVQKHSSPLIRMGSSPRSGSMVICQVRRESVSVTVDGKQACRFEGDLSKLVLPRDWSVNDDRAFIMGANNAAYFVSRWRLDPLAREAEAPVGGFGNPGFANPGIGAPGLGVPPDAKFPAGLTPPGTPLPRGPGGGLTPEAE